MNIRITFVDFWQKPDFEWILKCFRPEYNPIIDTENPEIVFYSCFGFEHLKYTQAVKVFVNGESYIPDFNDCDYALGTVKLDFCNRTFWYPLGIMGVNATQKVPEMARQQALNRKFCSFIYSQDTVGEGAILRKEFCQKLMKEYKHVHCPGKVLHNCDPEELSERYASDWGSSKKAYCGKFKFCIAWENENLPGYITEKLIHCYFANVVPIYWGSMGDIAPFPKESMIYAQDYASMDELIERIRQVDENDDEYMAMLAANPYREENVSLSFETGLKDFILKIAREKKPLIQNVRALSAAAKLQSIQQKQNRKEQKWYKRLFTSGVTANK